MIKISRQSKQTKQVIDLLSTKLTYVEIAKKFGISKQRVAQIAKENGLARYINMYDALSQNETTTVIQAEKAN